MAPKVEETKQEKVLRQVRLLLAKANGTNFEAERETFLAKADALMTEYAINEAMLKLADDPNAKLVIRKDMDFSWWWDINSMDQDARSEIYWLWNSCVTHCRCVHGGFVTTSGNREERVMPVFGTPSDLAYLDLLFTDLFMQMSVMLKPKYDPGKSMGENIAIAKQAGMTFYQIAGWMGRPDWQDTYTRKPTDKGVMYRAYKKYAAQSDAPWITMSPKAWQWSYVSGFCATIRSRLYQMNERNKPESGSGMELVIRDVRDQARDLLWEEFPDLKPHPTDCQCASCTRKPGRTKALKMRSRQYSELAGAHGQRAGEQAHIASNAKDIPSHAPRPQIEK